MLVDSVKITERTPVIQLVSLSLSVVLTVVSISTIINPNAADNKHVIGESKVIIKHIKIIMSYKFV